MFWWAFLACMLAFLILIFLIGIIGAYPWIGVVLLSAWIFFWVRHRARYPLPRKQRR